MTQKKIGNIEGLVFERLTAISYSYHEKDNGDCWLCRCQCGKTVIVPRKSLVSGNTRSCGCYHRDRTSNAVSKHRMTGTRLYRIWKNIKTRCLNKKTNVYERYGGRGITICDEWLNSFDTFLSDMGQPPTDKHMIDRIDNNKGYFKDNCRWVLAETNNKNKRNNKLLTFNGVTLCLQDWAELSGIKRTTIQARLRYGWSISDTLITPVKNTTQKEKQNN